MKNNRKWWVAAALAAVLGGAAFFTQQAITAPGDKPAGKTQPVVARVIFSRQSPCRSLRSFCLIPVWAILPALVKLPTMLAST
ncbi:MAG: hypothetical protein R3B84_20515 [Zavarzinella sp.]